MLTHARHTTNYQCVANYFGHFIMADLSKCHGSISIIFESHFQPFICPTKIISYSYCVHFIACSSSKDCHRSTIFHRPNEKLAVGVEFYFGQEHISAHSVYAHLGSIHAIHVIQVPLLLCKSNNTSFRYSVAKQSKFCRFFFQQCRKQRTVVVLSHFGVITEKN